MSLHPSPFTMGLCNACFLRVVQTSPGRDSGFGHGNFLSRKMLADSWCKQRKSGRFLVSLPLPWDDTPELVFWLLKEDWGPQEQSHHMLSLSLSRWPQLTTDSWWSPVQTSQVQIRSVYPQLVNRFMSQLNANFCIVMNFCGCLSHNISVAFDSCYKDKS